MPHLNLIVLRPSDFSLKIDQSVKLSRHRLSMGVACSYSSAPDLDMHTIYTKSIPNNFVMHGVVYFIEWLVVVLSAAAQVF